MNNNPSPNLKKNEYINDEGEISICTPANECDLEDDCPMFGTVDDLYSGL